MQFCVLLAHIRDRLNYNFLLIQSRAQSLIMTIYAKYTLAHISPIFSVLSISSAGPVLLSKSCPFHFMSYAYIFRKSRSQICVLVY